MTASERQRILNLTDGLEQIGRKMNEGFATYIDLAAALVDQLRKMTTEATDEAE